MSAQRDDLRPLGGEIALEFLQVRLDRRAFAGGGMLGVGGGGGRAVALEAASEDAAGVILGKRAGIDEKIVGRGGDLASGARELHDRYAGVHHAAERLLATRAEHAVVIAHGDDAGGIVLALELGDAQPDLQFPRTIADRVGERPLRIADHSDTGGRCGGRRSLHRASGHGEGLGRQRTSKTRSASSGMPCLNPKDSNISVRP